MLIITSNNEDKCINLKRKIILLNSSGKRNSNLFSPIDNGNKIYCSKKDRRGILAINRVNKKIVIIIINPRIPKIIFLILKLKTK